MGKRYKYCMSHRKYICAALYTKRNGLAYQYRELFHLQHQFSKSNKLEGVLGISMIYIVSTMAFSWLLKLYISFSPSLQACDRLGKYQQLLLSCKCQFHGVKLLYMDFPPVFSFLSLPVQILPMTKLLKGLEMPLQKQ